MRTKKATNLSLTPKVRAMADELVQLRGFANKSELVAQLIREEDERRNGIIQGGKAPGSAPGRTVVNGGPEETSMLNDAPARAMKPKPAK